MDIVTNASSGGKAEDRKCEWTPTMSSFMLTFLANVMDNGTKSLKKVHYNSCARAVNEHFKVSMNGD